MRKSGTVLEAPKGEKWSLINIEGFEITYPYSCEVGGVIELETSFENGVLTAKPMFNSKDLLDKHLKESRFVKFIEKYNKEFVICSTNSHFLQVAIPIWVKQIIESNPQQSIPLISIRDKIKINFHELVSQIFEEGKTYVFNISKISGDSLIGKHKYMTIELPKTQGFSYKNLNEDIEYVFNRIGKRGKLLFNPTTRFFITPERILGKDYSEFLKDSAYSITGCEEIKKQVAAKDNRWIISYFKFTNDVIVNAFERKDSSAFGLIAKLQAQHKYVQVKSSFLAGFAKSSSKGISIAIESTLQLIEAVSILHENKVDVINFEPFNNSLTEEQEARIIHTINVNLGTDYFSLAQINRLIERTLMSEKFSRDKLIHGLCIEKLTRVAQNMSWSTSFNFDEKVEKRKVILKNPEVQHFINSLIKYSSRLIQIRFHPSKVTLILNALRFAFLISKESIYDPSEFKFPYSNNLLDKESKRAVENLKDLLAAQDFILMNKTRTAILENGKVLSARYPYYLTAPIENTQKETVVNAKSLSIQALNGLKYEGEQEDGMINGIIYSYHEHSVYGSDYYAFTKHDGIKRNGAKVWTPHIIDGLATNIPKGFFNDGDEIPLKTGVYNGAETFKLDFNSTIFKAFTSFNPPNGEYLIRGVDQPKGDYETCPQCQSELKESKEKSVYCTNKECDFVFYPSVYIENELGLYRLFHCQVEHSFRLRLNSIINIHSGHKSWFLGNHTVKSYELGANVKFSTHGNRQHSDLISQFLAECYIEDSIIMHSENALDDLQLTYTLLKSPKSYLVSIYLKIVEIFNLIGNDTNQNLIKLIQDLTLTTDQTMLYFDELSGLSKSIDNLQLLFQPEQSIVQLDLNGSDKPEWKTRGLIVNYLISKKIYDEKYCNSILEDIKISLLSYFDRQELSLDKASHIPTTQNIEKSLIEKIITENLSESETLEFKETFVRPVHTYKQRKNIAELKLKLEQDIKEKAKIGIIEKLKQENAIDIHDKNKQKVVMHSTLKNICSMLNKIGGNIVIGIRDNKDLPPEAVGLFQDYELCGGFDDLELNFHQALRNKFIDYQFWSTYISTRKEIYQGKEFFVIQIQRISDNEKKVCFIKTGESGTEEKAYVKSGSSSITLAPSKVQSFRRPKVAIDKMPCFVYVVKNGRGNVKIGISSDPWRRMQTLSPENINLGEPICFKFKNRVIAKDIENSLHEKYSQYQIGNTEWYELGIEQYDSVIKDLRQTVNSKEYQSS